MSDELTSKAEAAERAEQLQKLKSELQCLTRKRESRKSARRASELTILASLDGYENGGESSAPFRSTDNSCSDGILALISSEFASLTPPPRINTELVHSYDSIENERELRRKLGQESVEPSSGSIVGERGEEIRASLEPMESRIRQECIVNDQVCREGASRNGKVLKFTIRSAFLRKCLVHSRGDVQCAAKIVQGFAEFRRHEKWPARMGRHEVEVALRTGMHWLLPRRDTPPEAPQLDSSTRNVELYESRSRFGGCLVYNAQELEVNESTPMALYQKMGTFLIERATDSFDCQLYGMCLVIDCTGFGLWSLATLSTSLKDIHRGVMMWRRSFPVRVRRIWVVDAPWGTGELISMALAAGAPELKEIIKFAYKSLEEPEENERTNNASQNMTAMGIKALVVELGGFFVLPESLGGTPGEFDWDSILNGDSLR